MAAVIGGRRKTAHGEATVTKVGVLLFPYLLNALQKHLNVRKA